MKLPHPCLLLVFLFIASPCLADAPSSEPIFGGRTLAGWEGDESWWRVEDGAIVGEIRDGERLGRNQFLFWDGEVHDFELKLEFRISGRPGANSGIQFRSQKLEGGECAGYQADLDRGATWLGRIYDEHGRGLLVERGTRVSIAPDGRRWVDTFAEPASYVDLLKPAEAWNTYQIKAVSSHVEIRINDRLCSVLDDWERGEAEFSGRIALQLHSGDGPAKLEFRNIQLADLGRTKFPESEETAAASFQSLESILPETKSGEKLDLGFESGTLQNWDVEGEAWEGQPAEYWSGRDRLRKSDTASSPRGGYYIGGHKAVRDRGRGSLVSTPFVVSHRWASYVASGSLDVEKARVEVVDLETGQVLHRAAGGGPGEFHRALIDLSPSLGREIYVRLIDESDEIDGRIGFDDFVFHGRKPSFDTSHVAAARLNESPALWHLQRNPADRSGTQDADAQQLVEDMAVVDGFAAELIAAEPRVQQPIAFTIDERGRIWVAEAYSYPNKRREGEGRDRIVIFEDANGDGSFEKRKVFIKGLNLVSGFELGFGGVWVGAAPELLFIPDRNGDDVPDGPPEVLLDGWGYQDTHETLNSFTWGPDGWLYGLQGVFTRSLVGKPGASEEERHRLRAGVWRYHPQRHEFEIFAHGGSNQWGIDFNEAGDLFMTHCRSFHGGGGTTYVIRNGHYWNQVNSDYAPFISNRGPDFAPGIKSYLPSSARYGSGEGGAGKPGSAAVYGGHSHVGTMIYLGDNWPDAYRDHLFTHNLHGQQINHQHNVRQGSGYETLHAGYDMLFAPDPSYLPVDLKYGPDGAVYMIDWSDLQHCHSPVNEAWERSSGRIYRLAWMDTWEPKKVDLGAMNDRELAELHGHKSEWHVRTARRLLHERSDGRSIDPAAEAVLVHQARRGEEASHRLRAVWTLHVTGNLSSGGLRAALRDPSDQVRAWAVRLGTQGGMNPQLEEGLFLQLSVADPSPVVRLALASAAPTMSDAARWTLAENLSQWAEDADDRFLPKMIWFSLANLIPEDFDRALALARKTRHPLLADNIRWHVAQSAEGRQWLVKQLPELEAQDVKRAIRVMAFSLRGEPALQAPPAWSDVREQTDRSEIGPETAEALDQLSALFGDESVLRKMRSRLADSSLPIDERRGALELLSRIGDVKRPGVYVELLDVKELQSQVIPMIAKIDHPVGARRLIELFDEFDASDQAAALTVLTSRPSYAAALLEAVQEGRFERDNVTSLHVRQMRALESEAIDAKLDRLWAEAKETPESLQQEIERLSLVREEYPMWAVNEERGRKAYAEKCLACHKLDGVGGELGPNLSGSWRNGYDYFLENIVAPNNVVGTNYQLHVIHKKDGSVVSGMIDSETDNTITVRTTAGVETVARNEIHNHEVHSQSMMPIGLLADMSDVEVLELLKYLTRRR